VTAPEHASRERVLAALHDAPEPLRLTALCTVVGLSPNAIRRHVGMLVEDGLVRIDHEPPQGPGRPAALYSAIPRSHQDPASAFRTLAGLLGRALSSIADPRVTGRAGRDWARRVLAERDATGRPRPADATELVHELFAEGGFAPRRSGGGDALELHGCPFLSVAAEQPDVVCEVHLGLVRGVLEEYGDPRHASLTPVLDGSGPCLLHLDAPRDDAAPITRLPEEAVS
jgi:predicted ArsR family transcriptional regulator